MGGMYWVAGAKVLAERGMRFVVPMGFVQRLNRESKGNQKGRVSDVGVHWTITYERKKRMPVRNVSSKDGQWYRRKGRAYLSELRTVSSRESACMRDRRRRRMRRLCDGIHGERRALRPQ